MMHRQESLTCLTDAYVHQMQMSDASEDASPSSSGHIVHARDRQGFFQDRSIHIAPTPEAAGDLPWPTSPPEYRV